MSLSRFFDWLDRNWREPLVSSRENDAATNIKLYPQILRLACAMIVILALTAGYQQAVFTLESQNLPICQLSGETL